MEKIVFYRTTNDEGVVRTLHGLVRPYQGLAHVFKYFAVVTPAQEKMAVESLAGGVDYLDNNEELFPNGRKYFPSFASVNYRDPDKVLWVTEAGVDGLLQGMESLISVQGSDF